MKRKTNEANNQTSFQLKGGKNMIKNYVKINKMLLRVFETEKKGIENNYSL